MEWARIGMSLFVIVMVAARLSMSRRSLSLMAKQALALAAIGLALIVGYSYRDDLNEVFGRAAGTMIPSRGVRSGPGVMRFSADDSGQFFVDATVDEVPIRFLIDTGASGIALSRADALHLGFDPAQLRYTARFSTANGTTRAAPVTLRDLRIGPFDATDVPAWVNEGDLDQSLLGMSYLTKLGRVEIRGDTMTLERGRSP